MKKRIIFVLAPMILVTLLTSCWSKRELNELAIVSALGIDKDGDDFTVTAQIINPRQIAQQIRGIQAPVTTYRTTGQTLFEAIRRLTLESPRKLYLAHIRIVVFGEELARDGIKKALDFLLRDHEFRTDFYLLVAKGERAENVLDVLTPIEQIPGNKVYLALETSQEYWGPTYAVDLEELAGDLTAEGKNAVLSGIIMKGSADLGMDIGNIEKVDVPITVQIGHLAAFKGDKLAGWLDETESRGYSSIADKITNSVVTMPWQGGGKLTAEITKQRTRVSAVLVNSRPQIEIDVRVEADIGDAECDVTLTEEQTFRQIEESLEREIKGFMEAAIKKARQDLKSDIFGFGDTIYRTYPGVWRNLRNNWDDEFLILPINMTVKAKIIGLGTITEAFQSKTKE